MFKAAYNLIVLHISTGAARKTYTRSLCGIIKNELREFREIEESL